jgi:hypothetical protein
MSPARATGFGKDGTSTCISICSVVVLIKAFSHTLVGGVNNRDAQWSIDVSTYL